MPNSLDSDVIVPPPQYLAPKRDMPDVVVDEYRFLIMDPTDMTVVGFGGGWGMRRVGRLVYADRTPLSRPGV